MSLDTWTRERDGTLRNDKLTITKVTPKHSHLKPKWRLDGWRWDRVMEFPDDDSRGWTRVEFTLGESDTLRGAKYRGEMHLRARNGEPRGVRKDWDKLQGELNERVELLTWQARQGFWDDLLQGRSPDFGEFGWALSFGQSDMEQQIKDLAGALLDVLATARERRSRAEKIEKVRALVEAGGTEHEAEAARRALDKLESA